MSEVQTHFALYSPALKVETDAPKQRGGGAASGHKDGPRGAAGHLPPAPLTYRGSGCEWVGWPSSPPLPGSPRTHLPIFVVDKDVAGAVVLQVGDLQAVGVAYLGWLEGGVQMLDLHDGLGLLGLEARVGLWVLTVLCGLG